MFALSNLVQDAGVSATDSTVAFSTMLEPVLHADCLMQIFSSIKVTLMLANVLSFIFVFTKGSENKLGACP
jgi:hypothetical protein